MSDEWEQGPRPGSGQPNFDDMDKRLEDIRRKVTQGASEVQLRLKRAVNKANDYWSQSQTAPVAHEANSVEEQRIRQLANLWSTENWRVARDLGTYMDSISMATDELWEITVQTRWEQRALEITSEPYAGNTPGLPKPIVPIWDYELPPVTGLKAPQTRTGLNRDEVVACASCNSTGHALCSNCSGRGWIVCPDCKGRTKKRCITCRGRGYVADWTPGEKKPFFRKQAENVASSVGGKVADAFDSIRQQGVPIPNLADSDPAAKGPTVPCPDCVNGEVPCTCGNGKRICAVCQGARMSLCSNCNGTGKVVRHREIVRTFDLHTRTSIVGNSPIPQAQLARAEGDLLYSGEVDETLHAEAPPENVPIDIWRSAVSLVKSESQSQEKPGTDPQAAPRATLQVLELVRISYTSVRYRYADEEYTFYYYDREGNEKFYAERFPARWDRIERLFKAISNDLVTPASAPSEPPVSNEQARGYRSSEEVPPYSIHEESEDK
ncbi:zinc finger-like domain-containing protein [Tengunoibacter tsumagoiensis]|uniref:Uncharacterized protein n=1 Tax=Tengunoibacter tsumagoiensis TaxID=2014871 RepID=A0A402A4M8_9CHLR|nr:zinc finger-like domain-containing protein [Tengunoibacter tsumagoiensis]GCE14114.1 hypothetical protein KTT_39730 [Tengunoibacter tsumagoiensis]